MLQLRCDRCNGTGERYDAFFDEIVECDEEDCEGGTIRVDVDLNANPELAEAYMRACVDLREREGAIVDEAYRDGRL